MKNSILLSVFIAALSSCGASNPTSSNVKNVPGDDSNAALLLGQGYVPVDGTAKGNCVTLGPLITQSGNLTGNSADYRLLEITSQSALREALNVSAQASFSGLVSKANARVGYSQSVNKNSQSKYLLVHTRVKNQLELARDFTFTPNAQKLIKEGDQSLFVKNCGSEFVYGRRTGGEFFALFEFEFSTAQEEKAFSAALSVSGSSWKGGASLNHELSKFNMNARSQVHIFNVGGTGQIPDVSDLSTFARNFPSMVSAVSGSPVTLELITKSYDGVEPIDLKPNTQLFVKQQYIMEQLAKNRDAAQELLNDVRYIKSHLSEYNLSSVPGFSSWEVELSKYINVQNDAAVECFDDIVKGCKLPIVAFPIVEIPAKKGSNCHVKNVQVCVIPGQNGACLGYKTVAQNVCN